MPLPGGEETQVAPQAFECGWDLSSQGIYILKHPSPGESTIEFSGYGAPHFTTIATGIGDIHSIAVSPDGKWLLYERHDRFESSIQVVENFR